MGGARFLYWKRPEAEELSAYGVSVEDYASPECGIEEGIYFDRVAGDWRFDLWAENWPAIQLFTRLSTQWRVGAGGPIGLDYTVLFHELDRAGLTGDDYDDTFASVRVIEGVALEELHKKD